VKTRLTLRRSFPQHQVPLPEPRVPLYFPVMLLHLGRGPNAPSPSPISPQERAVMNPWIPTPPRALPKMENFFTRYTDSKAVFPSFPIVQHNCLGSWDVFLSLFHSFTMLPHPPLLVAIQDPPSRRSVLPTFPGFMSFAPPPPGRPRVAIYVSRTLNQHLSCSTVFHDSSEMLSVDVFSPEGLFGTPHLSLRVTSVYLLRTNRPPYCSITPELVFSFLAYPHLVLGDFNLHHPLADPCRSLSEWEFTISTRYFDAAFDVPFHLLNTPGVYTRFPFDTVSRPSVLDLAFANTALALQVSSWDSPLPSTGSDHVPCVITLKPPAIMLPPLLRIGPSSTWTR